MICNQKYCNRCGIEITDGNYYSIKFRYISNGVDMSLSNGLRKSNREHKTMEVCEKCREKICSECHFNTQVSCGISCKKEIYISELPEKIGL